MIAPRPGKPHIYRRGKWRVVARGDWCWWHYMAACAWASLENRK